MQFVDIPFPNRIAFGARSEPSWSTTLVAMQNGDEVTNQNWIDARHTFDVAPVIRTVSDFALVREHFYQVRGRAKKFPFRDFLDYLATAAQGVIADTVDGWQLFKRYGSGSDLYDRKITRPSGTIQVFRTRSAVTTAISTTVDATTGIVTISGHMTGDTYTWAGEFNVPCRYDTDRLASSAVNKEPGPDGELYVDCDSIPIVEVRE
jgi:uncharacterized protein (TIGR02217 family)